jgi:hypothetical protein
MIASYTVVVLARLFDVVAVDQRLGFFHTVGIEIADGHNARLIELQDPGQIVDARDAADTDSSNIDAVAGRFLPEDAGGNNGRKAGCGSRTHRHFQKGPP